MKLYTWFSRFLLGFGTFILLYDLFLIGDIGFTLSADTYYILGLYAFLLIWIRDDVNKEKTPS